MLLNKEAVFIYTIRPGLEGALGFEEFGSFNFFSWRDCSRLYHTLLTLSQLIAFLEFVYCLFDLRSMICAMQWIPVDNTIPTRRDSLKVACVR